MFIRAFHLLVLQKNTKSYEVTQHFFLPLRTAESHAKSCPYLFYKTRSGNVMFNFKAVQMAGCLHRLSGNGINA